MDVEPSGVLRLIPVSARPSLVELCGQITEDNRHPDTLWGQPAGKAVWSFTVKSRCAQGSGSRTAPHPASGESWQALTNELKLPPGFIVKLYLMRWDIES